MNTYKRIRLGITAGLTFALLVLGPFYLQRVWRYVAFAVETGDWLNDFLTTLPRFVQEVVIWLH